VPDWFSVTFDDEQVMISAEPPGQARWEQGFRWSEVIRVCFRPEGLLASDGIYVFTSQRPESFAVPIEARGGVAFWTKVRDLGLFPHELAITAATGPEGTSVCWPP
jgi:hypothetical protein